jgi:hypothetical protein
MKSCNVGNTGDPLDSPECFGAGSLRSNEEADNCRAKNLFPEDVGLLNAMAKDGLGTIGGALDALPGCNPIQPGPEYATQQNCSGSVSPPSLHGDPANLTTRAAATDPTSKASQKTTKTAGSPSEGPSSSPTVAGVKLPRGWTYTGCFSNNTDPRVLGIQGEWWGQAMTSSGCVAHCDSVGKSIAGTEDGGQCFCGNELKQGQVPLSDECDQPCDGDDGQICGGKTALSIFRKSSAVKARRRHRDGRSAHNLEFMS